MLVKRRQELEEEEHSKRKYEQDDCYAELKQIELDLKGLKKRYKNKTEREQHRLELKKKKTELLDGKKHPKVRSDEIKSIFGDSWEYLQFLELFNRDKPMDEDVLKRYKEEKICLVCKRTHSQKLYICPNCDVLYCDSCAQVLARLKLACWSCNEAFNLD